MNDSNRRSAIEIYDSTLASVVDDGRNVVVALKPAYIHRSTGTPGVDPGGGWAQDVILRLENGTIDGSLPEMPCDLWEGSLQVGNQKNENIIPLPLDYRGAVTLILVPQDESRVVIRGSAVFAILVGEPKFIEEFPGVS
jgi:hypothetical protein